MNVNAFRHFYAYHFAENRRMWDSYVMSLSYEQFAQAVNYSCGSVREQIVHLIVADEVWFSELQNMEPLEPFSSSGRDDRDAIRAYWDRVEQRMRDYLATLDDAALATKPITEPEDDRELMVWQVLLHVANHATDHRAQLLRLLHDLGVETTSQDYIFYVYDNL